MIDIIKVIFTSKFGIEFLKGIGNTLLLALVGTIVGLIIAFVFGSIASFEIRENEKTLIKWFKKILNGIIQVYVTIFRGTPMIVQAMIFFYGFYSIGIVWTPIQAGLFTVSINTGAYLTEVIKNGIASVDKGQKEAAESLGMSKVQTMFFVVLPQALKTQMASIGNEFIINIKDTSVLNVIMVADLYFAAKVVSDTYLMYFETMLVTAFIYLFLTYTTSKLLKIVEKRLGAPVKEITSSN